MSIVLPWFENGDPLAPEFVQDYHRLLGDYYQTYDIGLFYAPQYVSAWQAFRFLSSEVNGLKSIISASGYQQILIDRFVPFKTPSRYDWLEKLELWILANYSYIGAEIIEDDILEIQLPNTYIVSPRTWVYYLTADNGDFNWIREYVEFIDWQPQYDVLHNSVIFFRPIVIEYDENGNLIKDDGDDEVIIPGYEQYIPEEIDPQLINLLHWESWCLRDMSSFPAERTYQKITRIKTTEVVLFEQQEITQQIFDSGLGVFVPFTQIVNGMTIQSISEQVLSIDSEPGANSFSLHYVDRANADPWGFREPKQPLFLGHPPAGYSYRDKFSQSGTFFANQNIGKTRGQYTIRKPITSPDNPSFLNGGGITTTTTQPRYLQQTSQENLRSLGGSPVGTFLPNNFQFYAGIAGYVLGESRTVEINSYVDLIDETTNPSQLTYFNINGRFVEQADSIYLHIIDPETEGDLFPEFDPEDPYPQLGFNMPDSIRTKEIHLALNAAYYGNGQEKNISTRADVYSDPAIADAVLVSIANDLPIDIKFTTLVDYFNNVNFLNAALIGLHNFPIQRLPTWQPSGDTTQTNLITCFSEYLIVNDFETQIKLGIYPVTTYNYAALTESREPSEVVYSNSGDLLADIYALETRASILLERSALQAYRTDINTIEIAKAIGSPFKRFEAVWDYGTTDVLQFDGAASIAMGIAGISAYLADNFNNSVPLSLNNLIENKKEQLQE